MTVETRVDSVDVILRGGETLRLRPPRREDADDLVDFFRTLSSVSLYRRFHGFPTIRPQIVEQVLDPDWEERGALLGTFTVEGEERIVALGNYIRLREPTVAEAAFAVADAYQNHGIGTRLVEQLAERAAETGITRFVAQVLAENRDMLGVFEASGFELTREVGGGEVEIEFPIATTEHYERQVAERDHIGIVASLRPFFQPRGVVVIGASRRRGSIGGELFRNIIEGDFTGVVFPVNKQGNSVAGVRGYATVAEIPDPVDLAVLCLPAAAVVEAAEQALVAGVRALVVISAGFAEIGSDGAARQERLLALVRAHGARLIGPNCLGIAVAACNLNATFAARAVHSGNVGFSSQSGALGLALLEVAESRGLGLSAFVSVGNKADVSSNDLLEWWEDDDETNAILLYLESFGNPRRFGSLARRVARSKPILALKSGSSAVGQRAASSHTAALAGSEAAVDALFQHAGVIRAESLEDLIDTGILLSSRPRLAGRRVAVLTNAGGLGILCADACDAAGLELPCLTSETREALQKGLPGEATVENPVDMLGSATSRTYGDALPLLLRDPQVDAVIVLFVPTVTATADDVANAIQQAATVDVSQKPVLAVVMSSDGLPRAFRRDGGCVSAFSYPESAARALGRAAARAEWLRRPQGSVPAIKGIDRAAAASIVTAALDREDDDGWLGPDETRRLLLHYGLPLVPERVVGSAAEAIAAAREFGFPCVVKTAVAGAHKSETGGVALDLLDDAAVRAAVERIGLPVLVQPMLQEGAELLAGIVQDPVFGPLVAFGPGGVFAELIGEASFRIAPLTDIDAGELVREGKAGRLVAGFRGAPAADTAALEELLHRLARLAEDLPAVAELDLNPVLARQDGCVALDARVRVREPEMTRRRKSW